jgi:GNAT superfamily N-acetyltransferase
VSPRPCRGVKPSDGSASDAGLNRHSALYGSGVEIVPFGPEHAAGFRELVGSVLAEFGFHEDPEIDRDLADPAAHYDAVWVVLAETDVVGSVAMRRAGEGEAELKRMYVRPGLRGHGLGRRLLDVALEWARSEGMGRVVLDTTEDMRAARRLYERAGFRRTGSRVERGAIDTRCEILYALDLDPKEHLQGAES